MLKSFTVLSPLLHGRGGEMFNLKPGQVVSCSLFTPEDAASLLIAGRIKPGLEKAKTEEPKPDKIAKPLPDITGMTAAESKELINAEVDTVRLEKFKDAESKKPHPRKGVLDFLNSRVKELTGYDA